jgi:glutaredoxin-related protein
MGLCLRQEFFMARPVLDEAHIHPAIREFVASRRQSLVHTVQTAVAAHAVVVVGMSMNPFPRKARRLLDAAGVAHHYLEFGSYFNSWRDRNALKMWTGWPTFPMVFVKGTLVGGADEVAKLLANGELKKMLA